MNPLTQKSDFLFVGHTYEVAKDYLPAIFTEGRVVLAKNGKSFVVLTPEKNTETRWSVLKRRFLSNIIKDVTNGRSFIS